MPPRTNYFQKLVKIINTHLAPSGATVTESAMIYDPEAEENREVDILIETLQLNCVIKIGIECTATSRALDIQAIEKHLEKHRKLGIHHTIIVAKNGFTKTAKTYAEKNREKLLTFSAAKRKQWLPMFEKLKKLSVYGRTYFLKSVSLEFDEVGSIQDFLMDKLVAVKDSNVFISLEEFSSRVFMGSEISKTAFKELKNNEGNGPDPWIKVAFDLDRKYEFRDRNNKTIYPLGMVLVYGYQSKYRDLDVGQFSYDDQDLLIGKFSDKDNGEHVNVVLTKTGDKLIGTLEFSESLVPFRGNS